MRPDRVVTMAILRRWGVLRSHLERRAQANASGAFERDRDPRYAEPARRLAWVDRKNRRSPSRAARRTEEEHQALRERHSAAYLTSRMEPQGRPEATDGSTPPDRIQRRPQQARAGVEEWKRAIAPYEVPSTWRALLQIVNTLGPIAVLWYLISLSLSVSLWLALPLALLVGALLVRVFIIFHDCGHGSFFRSRLANDVIGFVAGVLTFTPYYHWRWQHARHHATSGRLDERGTGDVWTMTVREYLEASRWQRLAYRLARNPFVLFVLAPVYVFVLRQRLPSPQASRRERRSVWWMNLAIAAMVGAMGWWLGFVNYLVLQLVATAVAGAAGVWLFYVQHQFEDAYWERGKEWDYTAAALCGSSFYELPPVLRWLSGNIGYHHVHHLGPRVPNYNLQRCHRSARIFEAVEPVTLLGSLKSLRLHLWDEGIGRLVGFARVRRKRRGRGRETGDDSDP